MTRPVKLQVKVFCILLLLPAASGSVVGQSPVQKIRFASGKTALRVPFELFGNLVLVQARVNNSEPLRFILDTGAETSVIDAQRATALGLKPHGKMVGSGGGGMAQATFTKGVSVSLPGVELLDQTIYVLPLESLSAVGRKIDGILGNDVLKEFVVEIDYAATSINLYDPHDYRYSGSGEIIPLTLDQGLPFATASVVMEGRVPIQAKFEIDSGSTGALLLNTPFVKRNRVLASVPKTIQTNIGGVGGTAKTLIGRIKNFRLGRFHPITRFSQATQGDYASSRYDGLIGGEMLRRFKVIFDYSRRQMILEPNEHFIESYEIDMSGIALVPDGDDLLVDDVEAHSPAAEAGVQGGDILVAIDDRPAVELGLDRIRHSISTKRQRISAKPQAKWESGPGQTETQKSDLTFDLNID